MEGALIRHQARVNPLRAVARLAAGLPGVATGVAATAVTIRGDRLVTVTPRPGRSSPARSCSPPACRRCWTGCPDLPSDRVKGHLLVTEPTPVTLPGIVAPVATQLEDGRLLVGGTFDMGDESPVVRPEIIEVIMAGLYATLPAARACAPTTSGAASGPGIRTGCRSSTGCPAWATPG